LWKRGKLNISLLTWIQNKKYQREARKRRKDAFRNAPVDSKEEGGRILPDLCWGAEDLIEGGRKGGLVLGGYLKTRKGLLQTEGSAMGGKDRRRN